MAQITRFAIVCRECGSAHTHLTDNHGVAIHLECLDCGEKEFIMLVDSDDPRTKNILNPESDPLRDKVIQDLSTNLGRTHES